MEVFLYPAARIMLYIVTAGVMIFFGISVYKERRRMMNCVLLILSIVLFWECITVVEGYVYAKDVTGPVIIPLMILAALFAVGMLANGLVVISKEGFSVAHSLSLLAGSAILLFIATYLGLVLYVLHLQELNHGVYSIPKLFESVFLVCMGLAAYVPLMMIGFALYSILYQKLPIKRAPDYIVVLGCGLSGDHVTPLLASRLDRGITFDKRNGKKAIFLVSGGKGSDEVVSEAQGVNGEVIGGKTASYYHPVAVIREHVALILAYKKLFAVYAAIVFILNIWHYFMVL